MDSNRHQENSANSKINYKNLFPRPTESPASMDALLGSMLTAYQVEDSSGHMTTTSNNNQRRFSQVVGAAAGMSEFGTSTIDTIRINLPEILDQQDEITILRLLIKLLSSKVTKLSDEKRRLLQNINILNDINVEMASIIERGLQK